MLTAVWAPFSFFFRVVLSITSVETFLASAFFLAGAMMVLFALEVRLPVLVQLLVGWGQKWLEKLVLLPKLVAKPVVVVLVLVEWFRLVAILLPATLPVALVSGHVIASFLPGGFPNSEVETKQTTIGQRWSSSFSPSVAPHTIGHVALRLTATPNQKFCPGMWR